GKHIVVLCDSWYPKKKFISRILSHENADIICNVRVDTAIYDLPPARTGKRGRPCKRGAQLSLDDFTYCVIWSSIGIMRLKVVNW
ncbi:MAG: transposase, partial [Selenomonadaceae bacterium]|nr:transposase [Selenomonadaceae bacterium]